MFVFKYKRRPLRTVPTLFNISQRNSLVNFPFNSAKLIFPDDIHLKQVQNMKFLFTKHSKKNIFMVSNFFSIEDVKCHI